MNSWKVPILFLATVLAFSMSLHAQSVTARQYSTHVEALNGKIGDVRTMIGNINRDLESFSNNLDAPHNLYKKLGHLSDRIEEITQLLSDLKNVKQIEPAVSPLLKGFTAIDTPVKTAAEKLDDVDKQFIQPVKKQADNVLKVTQDFPTKILSVADDFASQSATMATDLEACLNDIPEGDFKSKTLPAFSEGLREADQLIVRLDETVSSILETLEPLEQAVSDTKESIETLMSLIGQISPEVDTLEGLLHELNTPIRDLNNALATNLISWDFRYGSCSATPKRTDYATFLRHNTYAGQGCGGLGGGDHFWDAMPLFMGSCWSCGSWKHNTSDVKGDKKCEKGGDPIPCDIRIRITGETLLLGIGEIEKKIEDTLGDVIMFIAKNIGNYIQ